MNDAAHRIIMTYLCELGGALGLGPPLRTKVISAKCHTFQFRGGFSISVHTASPNFKPIDGETHGHSES